MKHRDNHLWPAGTRHYVALCDGALAHTVSGSIDWYTNRELEDLRQSLRRYNARRQRFAFIIHVTPKVDPWDGRSSRLMNAQHTGVKR